MTREATHALALLGFAVVAAMVLPQPVAAESVVRRVAVLVGANHSPAGRAPLRYSYHDVQEMSDVLIQTGQFAPEDVHVLHDPRPSEVLDLLDQQLGALKSQGGETLLLFYYSGHADDRALYPDGKPLSLASLKERLERKDATVRVGILDSCNGGGWTRTKGLHADEPFEVDVPLTLSSEGSALIASSSGLENAHESAALEGSFFTHHLVAGLRGAAARSGNGEVTLGEAFAYAEERTIRDSAEQAGSPQHPSFDIHLRGRQDLALARVDTSPSLVKVQEVEGPLQVIQLHTGLVVLEIPAGRRDLQLALPPSRYLVQRRTGNKTFASEIVVEPGHTVELQEENLELVGTPRLASKDEPDLPPTRFTLSLRGGVLHEDDEGVPNNGGVVSGGGSGTEPAAGIGFTWRITDRLTLSTGSSAGGVGGSLSYRFTGPGSLQFIPWAGLTDWGLSLSSTSGNFFKYGLGAGLTTRLGLGSSRSLSFGLGTFSNTAEVPLNHQASVTGGISPDIWSAEGYTWFTQDLKRVVTLNVGLSLAAPYLANGGPPTSSEEVVALGIGSVGGPLISVHLTPTFSLTGWATLYVRTDRTIEDEYLAGFSWSF